MYWHFKKYNLSLSFLPRRDYQGKAWVEAQLLMTSGRVFRPQTDAVWLQCACVSLTRSLPFCLPLGSLQAVASRLENKMERKPRACLASFTACNCRTFHMNILVMKSWCDRVETVPLSEARINMWPPLRHILCMIYEIFLQINSYLALETTHRQHIANCICFPDTNKELLLRFLQKVLRNFAPGTYLSGPVILPWNSLHCNEYTNHPKISWYLRLFLHSDCLFYFYG